MRVVYGKKQGKNSSLKKYIVAERYGGMVLADYLKEVMGVSARQRQKLFFAKGVYVNGSAAHSQRIIKAGDMVAIRQYKDTGYGVTPQPGDIDVLYEDKDIIILNKPAGILVHPAGQTKDGTLANYLAEYFRQKGETITIRPLHRLDRDTTGCVLFAKSAAVQQKLEVLLQQGQLHRQYLAVVKGNIAALQKQFTDGCIDLPLARVLGQANRR